MSSSLHRKLFTISVSIYTRASIHTFHHRSSTSLHHDDHLTARQRRQLALSTSASRVGVDLAAASTALVNTLVLLADLLCRSARPTDGGCITEVGVDTDQIRRKAKGANVLDDDLARRFLAVIGAVSAGAVQFACVDDGVVFDGYGASAAERGC